MIAENAIAGVRGTSAKVMWQMNIRIAPIISIVAPLPLWSRNQPSSGVRIMAPIGNQRKMSEACWLVMPRLLSSIPVAKRWNGKIAE